MNRFPQIQDRATIEKFADTARRMLDSPIDFSYEWLNQQDWIVVPIENPCSETEMDGLIESIERLGLDSGYAILTDSLGEVDETILLEIAFTRENLEMFCDDIELSFYNCLVFPENLAFALLQEAGEFCLIAGSLEFVTQAISKAHKTIEKAREAFQDYATALPSGTRARSYLVRIAQRYNI